MISIPRHHHSRARGRRLAAALASFTLLAACSDDEATGVVANAMTPAASTAGGDAGTTPTALPASADAVGAFLDRGDYKSWRSETAVHAARSPSPHGFNRVYSNPEIASRVEGEGSWPAGAAAVKELYDSADATTPIGYAYYLKTKADSAGGASWYWYERSERDVVAAGLGGAGVPKTVCVGCHTGAGTDAAHTPSIGGRDFVYTPVR